MKIVAPSAMTTRDTRRLLHSTRYSGCRWGEDAETCMMRAYLPFRFWGHKCGTRKTDMTRVNSCYILKMTFLKEMLENLAKGRQIETVAKGIMRENIRAAVTEDILGRKRAKSRDGKWYHVDALEIGERKEKVNG